MRADNTNLKNSITTRNKKMFLFWLLNTIHTEKKPCTMISFFKILKTPL